MKREFVPLADIVLYSVAEKRFGNGGCHYPDKHGKLIGVNKKRDGKTLEEHLEGIEYFAQLIRDGVKLLPPLVIRTKEGKFKKLDGFKRILGMKKAGVLIAECFVAETEDRGKSFNYDGNKLTVRSGGQPYSKFTSPVEYGEAVDQAKNWGKIINLYVGPGLKIEYRENIHIHWGPKGRNRLVLGRQDFDLLVGAFNGEGC